MRTAFAPLLAVLMATLLGCSSGQIYSGLQAGQRNACQKYAEPDRSRCLAANDMDYERYRRERDEMTPK
jgi:hypothetical protein